MNPIFQDLPRIKSLIENNQNFLIIPHRSPDGDALGGAFSIYLMLKSLGKNPSVWCIDPAPNEFSFIPSIEDLKVGTPSLDYDAVFIVDSGAPHLTGMHEVYPQLFDKSLPVVNIDHHHSNAFYGKFNIVDTQAASVTMVIYQMFLRLGYKIDRFMATALLTGIYTDTGSMMHSNTSSEVLRVAARLMAKGADLRSISKQIFNTTKISTMRLWGRVLKNIHQTKKKVTMSFLTKADFEQTKADYSELSGVVDYVNSVPGAKYSVIITERGENVKGSLRTLNDDVDVSKIAGRYGGGGHKKASGFTIKGQLKKEVRWKVIHE